MNGKICASPKGGGSGRGAVRYILGYSLGSSEKDETATRAERAVAYDRLQAEGLAREDLGVGAIWEPEEGRENGRPAAIYCDGVTSLATADQEMDAYAAIAKRAGVREPTMHFVFSFSPEETTRLSNEQMVLAARTALERMGLADHAKVLALHMDEPHGHIHAAVSATDPKTLLSWERNRDRFRISRACREAEIEHDLHHDRGLYMAREGADGVMRVELRTPAEAKAQRREDREERLAQAMRRSLRDYEPDDYEDPTSWREAVVAQMVESAEAVDDAGMDPTWADAHAVAAASNARLRCEVEGEGADRVEHVYLDLYERVPEDERGTVTVVGDDGEPEEREGPAVRPTGVSVEIPRADLPYASAFLDADEAERDFAERITADPTIISRTLDLVEGRGVFTRGDVDRYIGARVTAAEDVARLGDEYEQNDKTIRIVTADTATPTFVREKTLAMQERVAERAREMANTRDDEYDAFAMQRAILHFEQRVGYTISDEQRALVEAMAQHKLAWCNGEAGSGKTTSMLVLKEYAREINRPIIGLATSEAAARKLSNEAGFPAFNLAKAIVEEERGNSVIPERAFIVLEETSMTSYRALDRVTELALARNASLPGIGDSAQIQNIEGGSPHDVLRGIAADAGSYVELREVRRQRGNLEWMREVVSKTGEAIREGDGAGVAAYVSALEEHGVLHAEEDRKATLDAAVAWYLESPEDSILAAKDRRTARHVNDTIREELGLAGSGHRFRLGRSGNETRELALDDRVQFMKNHRRLGIVNNDTGTVVAMDYDERKVSWTVRVRLDDGREISFDPAKYRNVEHGFCVTAHKSQGQDRRRAGAIWDKSIDANTAHVNTSRAREEAAVFYAKTNFETAGDVAAHLAERIVAKDDVLLLERVIAKTGGPETAWAQNVRAALAQKNHPLRKQYAAERVARTAAINERRLQVTRAIGQRMAAANADERAELTAELRTRTAGFADVAQKDAELTFAAWSVKNKAQIERAAEHDRARDTRDHEKTRDPRREALEHAREQEQERMRQRGRGGRTR